MEIKILDAHDRLEHLLKTTKDSTSEFCQQIMDQKPFGIQPFYIFAHKRELGVDEIFSIYMQGGYKELCDVPTAKIIWQPRLTKPKAQPNSMLFKAYPGTDVLKIIWMLPDERLWNEYKKDNLTESDIVEKSIYDYLNNKDKLETKEADDLNDEQARSLYRLMGYAGKGSLIL